MLVKNWIRAALVAQGTTENADSMSQFQIEPDMPNIFTPEQFETFYTYIKIGFNEADHTFGTNVANGLLNCLHPSFIPELEMVDPYPDVIDVDNKDDCQFRTRTDTSSNASSTQKNNWQHKHN
jgi:hypothetical protein